MITKEYKTWKFEELTEEQQEKALERYRYFNVEDSFWYDYDGKTGFTAEELKRMRVNPYDKNTDELIKWKHLYFDLDRSWYIQFTDARFVDDEIARKFLRVPRELWNNVYWSFVSTRENTTRLEYEHQDSYKDFTPKQIEILDRAVELFSNKMDEALKGLRDNYEYALSDEAVRESLIANDYDFTAEGKIG